MGKEAVVSSPGVHVKNGWAPHIVIAVSHAVLRAGMLSTPFPVFLIATMVRPPGVGEVIELSR